MIKVLARYKFSALYFLSIVLTNAAYAWFGETLMFRTPFGAGGETWSPLAVFVGFWFILRDYAQLELGNRVLLVMCAGMAASYAMAGGVVATASAIAFAASELIDWAVFSAMRKQPFARRVLASSLIAAPIDTALFFAMADHLGMIPGVRTLTWPTVVTETLSKLLAAYVVYLRIRKRTPKDGTAPAATSG